VGVPNKNKKISSKKSYGKKKKGDTYRMHKQIRMTVKEVRGREQNDRSYIMH
jgi:hypothetical protein